MSPADILPSGDDSIQLLDAGKEFILRFLTKNFSAFSHLQSVSNKSQPYKKPVKPTVTPLKIVDVNEGRTDGNIEVLEKCASDLKKNDMSPMVGQQILIVR